MFAISKNTHAKSKRGSPLKVSSAKNNSQPTERRKSGGERRFPVERRKVFSSLFAGADRREKKLKERRNVSGRREADQQSATKMATGSKKLELNASSIDRLIKEQMLITKNITKLIPFKKGVPITELERNVHNIYSAVKSVMQKEEYLLCLYLETNSDKLSDVHIEKLLTIIDTDISKLSDELMQIVQKYYIAKVNKANIGFVQLDLNIIREKIILCLYKKKKHLYPIYILN